MNHKDNWFMLRIQIHWHLYGITKLCLHLITEVFGLEYKTYLCWRNSKIAFIPLYWIFVTRLNCESCWGQSLIFISPKSRVTLDMQGTKLNERIWFGKDLVYLTILEHIFLHSCVSASLLKLILPKITYSIAWK